MTLLISQGHISFFLIITDPQQTSKFAVAPAKYYRQLEEAVLSFYPAQTTDWSENKIQQDSMAKTLLTVLMATTVPRKDKLLFKIEIIPFMIQLSADNYQGSIMERSRTYYDFIAGIII